MTLEERLENVEKELMRGRRFNRWLLAGLGIVIVVWIVGWAFRPETATAQSTETVAREVRARLFIIEDDKGRTRAMLGTFKDGSELQLSDENGKTRVVLIASKDESELQLQANDKMRAWLHASDSGSLLHLHDEHGDYRVGLDVFKEGAKLNLCDAKGKTLWKAP